MSDSVWMIVKLYDDGDPHDKAHVSEVFVFASLKAAREHFDRYDSDMYVDAEPEDLKADGLTLDDCKIEPELYQWVSSDHRGGWDGGYVLTFHEKEVLK